MKRRVAVVEDNQRLRRQLLQILSQFEDIECVGNYGSGEEALEQIPHKNPEVVLMDIKLPKMSGIECVHELKKIMPLVQIIIVTVYEDSECIFDAIKAGANGYLIKSGPPERLIEGIRDIASGGSPMSGHIARKVVGYFRTLGPATGKAKPLAPREEQVLTLLASGYLYKEIGAKLGLSVETVRTYVKNACTKMHVRSRIEAVAKYCGKH
ncbi:response regulator transcription factor [Pedosphaera parvula]|uniref:Two component transcriptional regulator, LuxR family n=1 Tax=Pedosphaera parvula (strain Ellin514) TaxID=320771 RepID=B9XHK9_PEDPL|nr:response regulator transcription factor [Pedosphaera parvula]EEF60587.1 two component transcriptional regulator, LuxR family [Pedosphaera parvula Ellin514]